MCHNNVNTWLILVVFGFRMGRKSFRECSGTFELFLECSTILHEGSTLDFLIQNHNLSKMTILIGYFLTPLLTPNRLPNRCFPGNGTIIWIIKKTAIFDGFSSWFQLQINFKRREMVKVEIIKMVVIRQIEVAE